MSLIIPKRSLQSRISQYHEHKLLFLTRFYNIFTLLCFAQADLDEPVADTNNDSIIDTPPEGEGKEIPKTTAGATPASSQVSQVYQHL